MTNVHTQSRKGTTKSGGQKHDLDKFYTKPDVAKWCLEQLNLSSYSTVIEPSAGSGSFSHQIPNVLAMDLEPEDESIIKQDWFQYHIDRDPENPILVVGNPPFGQQNVLAIEFINHAAKFANTIAFILPVSFMKESLQNKLNKNLHLSQYFFLPSNSFTLNGTDMSVPCVFQIWDYKDGIQRVVPPTPKLVGFSFVKKGDQPDLFLQRVGGNAGSFGLEWQNRSEQSNYFLRLKDGFYLDNLLADLGKLTFPYRDWGVGPRTASKKEILLELLKTGSTFVEEGS